MNKDQKAASQLIMNILLALPWDQREDAFAAVRFNDIFCVHCGIGEPAKPNINCQCTNDE